jgi:hypothetical protein
MTEDHQHCRHCQDPDSPNHQDEVYLAAERACAFYEDPEHLRVSGPGQRFMGSKRLAELTRLGEEIGDTPTRVCLAHHSINVCRHAGECSWSSDPEDVREVEKYHGTSR